MSKTRSNLVISHMDQEERRHWASWIGMIAEGVAGVMAVNGGIPASRDDMILIRQSGFPYFFS